MTDITRIAGDPDKDASRLLATSLANLDGVLFQRDQIPPASEWTLVGQIAADRVRRLAAALGTPGFSTKETIAVAGFDLTLPVCRAVVGDEPIRVGQGGAGVSANVVPLGFPPVGGTRTDVVILESWVAEIAPIGAAGSTSQALNVAGRKGGTNVATDPAYAIQDPEIGEETARRLAVRWALRVVEGIDLGTYPAGLGDPTALGQGDAAAPIAGRPFVELADRTGVFRAGDGSAAAALDFANATGYCFALPVIAVVRTAGESALTLTGATDLRNQIISRVGVAMSMVIDVLPAGVYTVGTGASGEAATWRQPKLGGATSGFYPANLPGTDNNTPLSGAFVVPLNDFDLPPGWSLSGKLYGNVFRQESGSGTAAKNYGIRVRRPGQTYGSSVAEVTFALGPVSSSDGDYKPVEDQHAAFDVPSDGSAAGVWVCELYSEVAAAGIFVTSGIKLRIWAENV